MKRSLAFFFFLFLFSQCEKVENTQPEIIRGIGLPGETPANQSGLGTSSVITNQPSLSKKPAETRKRRKKRASANTLQNPEIQRFKWRNSDTNIVNRLKHLRSDGVEPDLNEPVSRDYLFTPTEIHPFSSMISLSHETFLKINFDNDILDYTDRFFTNGIKIEFISPIMQANPPSRLLLPYWSSGTN